LIYLFRKFEKNTMGS